MMAKIEYYAERKETLDLPKCFCGEEPELIDDYDDVGDYRYYHVRIQCPYCRAHTDSYGWNTFKPKWKAVEEAAEDWIKLIMRYDYED
jgi:hypothetical protein